MLSSVENDLAEAKRRWTGKNSCGWWLAPSHFLRVCFFLRFEIQNEAPSLSHCFAPISVVLRSRLFSFPWSRDTGVQGLHWGLPLSLWIRFASETWPCPGFGTGFNLLKIQFWTPSVQKKRVSKRSESGPAWHQNGWLSSSLCFMAPKAFTLCGVLSLVVVAPGVFTLRRSSAHGPTSPPHYPLTLHVAIPPAVTCQTPCCDM